MMHAKHAQYLKWFDTFMLIFYVYIKAKTSYLVMTSNLALTHSVMTLNLVLPIFPYISFFFQ